MNQPLRLLMQAKMQGDLRYQSLNFCGKKPFPMELVQVYSYLFLVISVCLELEETSDYFEYNYVLIPF